MAGTVAKSAETGAKAAPARGPSGRGGAGLVPPASGMDVVDQLPAARAAPLTLRVPVGGADDPAERDADGLAARVLGFPAPRRASGAGGAPPPASRPALGSGKPLGSAALGFFEARFGRDLGHIRVHDNEAAAASAHALGARAFALGHDLAFARGAYAPETIAGQRLLAHELAHAVAHPDGVLRREGDGDAVKRVVASATPTKAPNIFSMRFEFASGTVTFEATLASDKAVGAGNHEGHLSADPRDPVDKPANIVVYFRIKELSARLSIEPSGGNASAALAALHRARRYLLEHPDPGVVFRLENIVAPPAGEKGGGKSEGGGGDKGILPPEPWLASELVPAVRAKLDAEHADAHVTELIGHRATRVEREEGANTAMLQAGRDSGQKSGTKAVMTRAWIRVHKDKWEGHTPAERATYAAAVATEAVAAIERAAAKRLWTNPDLAGQGTGGRGYEYPPLPARIDGLAVQPIGGTGTFSLRLDYSRAAPDLLSQASWAAKPVRCRWELWDISDAPEVKAAEEKARAAGKMELAGTPDLAEIETTVRRGDKTAGSQQVTERFGGTKRDWERVGEDLAKRPGQIEADERAAREQGRYADVLANELNRQLLGLEVITKYGKQTLLAAADLFGDSTECSIPWNKPGIFVLRCIARVDPDAPPEAAQRAPSVATLMVTVRSLESISAGALDTEQNQLNDRAIRLALLKAADPNNKAAIEQAQAELEAATVEATGSAVEVIQARKAEVDRQLAKARKESILIPAGLHDPKVWSLERQQDSLATQLKLALTREGRTGSKDAPVRRLHASLVSRITGQIYPLLLQIGTPLLQGGTWTCQLSDVTSGDGEEVTGKAPDKADAPEEAKAAAVWNAVELFAGLGAYGDGSLSVRLPNGMLPGLKGAARVRTAESRTKDLKAAKARLEELGTLLAVVALVVGAPALGVAGGLIAAGLAADRMITRIRNDTFRLDTQAVGDILDLLGPIAMGAKAVGALAKIPRPGGGFVLKAAQGAGKVVGLAGTVADKTSDIGGILMCNLETANALLEIGAQQRAGEMSATQARRAIAERVASAIQSNAMTIGSHLTGHEAPEGERKKAPDAPEKKPAGAREGGPGEAARERVTTADEGRRVAPAARGELPPVVPEALATEARPAKGQASAEKTAGPEPPRTPEADAPKPSRAVIEAERKQAHDALPDGTVMMDPEPTNHVAARQNYHTMIAEAPTHETAMYRNTRNGIFICVQGNTEIVAVEEHGQGGKPESPRGAGQAQRWKEILDAGEDVGDWELVAHSHGIDPATGSVKFRDRFPSGAAADFGNVITGPGQTTPKTSRIDYMVKGTLEHTLFGYDPNGGAAKVWVDYPDQFGQRQRIEFPDVAGYHTWFKDTFNIDLGPIPPELHAPAAPKAPSAAVAPGGRPVVRNDRVTHPTLGNGTVELVTPPEKKGDAPKIKIRFDSDGQTRTILADRVGLADPATDVPPPPETARPTRPKPAQRAEQAGKKARPFEATLERQQELLKAAIQERAELARRIAALKAQQRKGQDRTVELREAQVELAALEGEPATDKKPAVPGEIALREAAVESAKRARAKAKMPLYEQLEGAARSKTEPIKKRAGKGRTAAAVDEINGQSRPELNVDHIVPVIDIVLMRGFEYLSYAQQLMILTWEFNLLAMDATANKSKGALSWAEWSNAGDYYGHAERNTWSRVEADNRAAIETWIDKLLGGDTGYQPARSERWAARTEPPPTTGVGPTGRGITGYRAPSSTSGNEARPAAPELGPAAAVRGSTPAPAPAPVLATVAPVRRPSLEAAKDALRTGGPTRMNLFNLMNALPPNAFEELKVALGEVGMPQENLHLKGDATQAGQALIIASEAVSGHWKEPDVPGKLAARAARALDGAAARETARAHQARLDAAKEALRTGGPTVQNLSNFLKTLSPQEFERFKDELHEVGMPQEYLNVLTEKTQAGQSLIIANEAVRGHWIEPDVPKKLAAKAQAAGTTAGATGAARARQALRNEAKEALRRGGPTAASLFNVMKNLSPEEFRQLKASLRDIGMDEASLPILQVGSQVGQALIIAHEAVGGNWIAGNVPHELMLLLLRSF